LAQGTSWAVAVTQAFLLPGSILSKRALCFIVAWNQHALAHSDATLSGRHPL
jgi:hypothetical protein